jgi:hypothetical protein
VILSNLGKVRDRTPAEDKNNGGSAEDQYSHAGYISGPHLWCPQCGTKHIGKKEDDFSMDLCENCQKQVTHKSKLLKRG